MRLGLVESRSYRLLIIRTRMAYIETDLNCCKKLSISAVGDRKKLRRVSRMGYQFLLQSNRVAQQKLAKSVHCVLPRSDEGHLDWIQRLFSPRRASQSDLSSGRREYQHYRRFGSDVLDSGFPIVIQIRIYI